MILLLEAELNGTPLPKCFNRENGHIEWRENLEDREIKKPFTEGIGV